MKEVEYLIEALPEDDGPEGHFASGDDEQDAETVAEIERKLETNEWAWCIVRVTARLGQFEGVAYLGGCSYEDAEDFKKGGYFEQMKKEALDDLKETLKNALDAVAVLLTTSTEPNMSQSISPEAHDNFTRRLVRFVDGVRQHFDSSPMLTPDEASLLDAAETLVFYGEAHGFPVSDETEK